MISPGYAAAVVGPSGSGKSHLVLTALQHYGSGIVCLAPGVDEIESYAALYGEAARPEWNGDEVTFDTKAPYVLAEFDDPDFAPSLGRKHMNVQGQSRMLFFLRAVRQVVQRDLEAGKPPRWAVVAQDTFSGVSELCYNAQLASAGITEAPKARGDGGASFYGGLQQRMGDISRASRVLRGLGMHWLVTAHVKEQGVGEGYKVGELSSAQQIMPLIAGGFREKFMGMFDLGLYSGVDKLKEHYVIWKPEMKRQAKSRYGALSEASRMENDWPTILKAVEAAKAGG